MDMVQVSRSVEYSRNTSVEALKGAKGFKKEVKEKWLPPTSLAVMPVTLLS